MRNEENFDFLKKNAGRRLKGVGWVSGEMGETDNEYARRLEFTFFLSDRIVFVSGIAMLFCFL